MPSSSDQSVKSRPNCPDESVNTMPDSLDEPVGALSEDVLNMWETIVFWDIDDCPIPRNLTADDVSENIRKSLEKRGYLGPVTIYPYGYMDEEIMDGFDGFSINPINTGETGYRHKMILADLFAYTIDNHYKPTNLMLIVGDISRQMGFLMAIHALKSQQVYNILLAQPEKASELLHEAVSTQWLWKSLAFGGDHIHQSVITMPSSPLDSNMCIDFPQSVKSRPSSPDQSVITRPSSPDQSVITRPSSPDESFRSILKVHDAESTQFVKTMPSSLDISEPHALNTRENIVFWNVDDCPIPKGLDAFAVSENIKKALEKIGYIGKLTIYSYVHRDHWHTDLDVISSTVVHLGERDWLLNLMLFNFLDYICGACLPKNLMLIMGDISGHMGFIMAIHSLLSRKFFDVLLAQPQNASDMLHGAVSREWLWTSLATGGCPIDQSESSLLPIDNTCVGSRSLRFLVAAVALVCIVMLSR